MQKSKPKGPHIYCTTYQPCCLVFLGIRVRGGFRQPRWMYRLHLSHLASKCWSCVFLQKLHLEKIIPQKQMTIKMISKRATPLR